MKRIVHLGLLLGALLGLFGQSMANASVGNLNPSSEIASVTADCMAAMMSHKKSTQSPCQSTAQACVSVIGCAVPINVVNNIDKLAHPVLSLSLGFYPKAVILHGVARPPEPRPPSILS